MTSSGTNWHYHSEGEGETALFLHGWSFDGSVWFKQKDFLEDRRVVILDLPGHGQSDYNKQADVIGDIKFIIDELGLGQVTLIGHSLGGFLSLKLSIKYPASVKKLVLIGAPAKFVRSPEHESGLQEKDINKLRSFLTGNYPDILLVFLRWLFTGEERKQGDFRADWDKLSKKERWPQKEAMDDFLYVIEKEDVMQKLDNIIVPSLIVSGVGDPICPVESIDYLNKHLNNSKVELFEDCGHLPFLTKHQQFNKLVNEFIG